MNVIEYMPRTGLAIARHRRKIRRMADGVMPRNTLPALLIAAVAVLAAFCMALMAWWNAGAVAETYARVTVSAGSGLNVRKGPGAGYESRWQLASGAKVLLLDSQSGWALVAWPKYPEAPLGWVSIDYIEVVR